MKFNDTSTVQLVSLHVTKVHLPFFIQLEVENVYINDICFCCTCSYKWEVVEKLVI